jgi:hypothetical protein
VVRVRSAEVRRSERGEQVRGLIEAYVNPRKLKLCSNNSSKMSSMLRGMRDSQRD